MKSGCLKMSERHTVADSVLRRLFLVIVGHKLTDTKTVLLESKIGEVSWARCLKGLRHLQL